MTENVDIYALDLYALKQSDLTQSEADVLRILNDSLANQPDPATASAKLVRSLREHGSKSESLEIIENFLWDLWTTLMDLVRVLPIDHPWHEILIVAVDDLRRQGGAIAASDVSSIFTISTKKRLDIILIDIYLQPSELWGDLPQLSMYIYDKWAGKLTSSHQLTHSSSPRTI